MERPTEIEKVLSANDVGETGAHQVGMLVPKTGGLLSFFPALNRVKKNPRSTITLRDDAGREWVWSFIYYNNKLFGGTRDEYRLTSMRLFCQAHGLRSGDVLVFRRSSTDEYSVSVRRQRTVRGNVVQLRNSWKIVKLQLKG